MNILPDVQKNRDGFHKIFIDMVGVENIKKNIPIMTRKKSKEMVMATLDSYCSLTEDVKGIHMSRIGRTIENFLNNYEDKNGITTLQGLVEALQIAHKSKDVYLKANFAVDLDYKTPVTDLKCSKPVEVNMESYYRDGIIKNFLTVKSTEMSLCPCSKEMSLLRNNLTEEELNTINKLPENLKKKILRSGFGAHNQKSEIKITVEIKENRDFKIDDLVDICIKSASSPTFPILKREDEKWVTEVSYMGAYINENKFIEVGGGPKFVEDISRDAASVLMEHLDVNIEDFRVEVRNQESIHSDNINATSVITAKRNLLFKNWAI